MNPVGPLERFRGIKEFGRVVSGDVAADELKRIVI